MAVGAMLMPLPTVVVALNAQLLRRIDLRPEMLTAGCDARGPEPQRGWCRTKPRKLNPTAVDSAGVLEPPELTRPPQRKPAVLECSDRTFHDITEVIWHGEQRAYEAGTRTSR